MTKIQFELDGKQVEAIDGETIWQVAQREGTKIPHLCWHPAPGYRADGNCRACMVEVEGERVLAASCQRKAVTGMKVKTASERAKKSRQMVFELLMADQPERETSHDPASKFWNWVDAMSVTPVSRFPRDHRPAADVTHSAIAVNLDACINCGLCVRACREVQANDVIGMAFRGHEAKVVFDFDQGMGQSTCVACGECVQVCPTGIDIRDGLQYQCIGCAACIDGCNQVMDKVGKPQKLIRYSTTHALEGTPTRILRLRVLIYAAILALIVLAAGASLWLRVPLKVDVIRDRTAIAREVEDGRIENVYRLQIMNTTESAREFEVAVAGLPALQLATATRVLVGAAENLMVPVRVRAEPGLVPAGTHKIQFGVRAMDDERVAVEEKSVFIMR